MKKKEGPPTASGFRAILSAFEDAYRKCLDALLLLKAGELFDGDNAELLQNFQPRLYQALLRTSREYNRIGSARRDLIRRKDSLNLEWFRRRQRTLAARQATLVRAIRVGRTLGDAFIWFFYRADQALLKQHLSHPAPSPPPTGVGGDGELALVDGVRMVGGKYVLFHGISSMFRLGDASLFDFKKMRIVGIGELKTVRVSENTLEMQFNASVFRDAGTDFGPKPPNPVTTSHLTEEQSQRLKQQLSRISEAAKNAAAPARQLDLRMPEMGHASELNELVRSAKPGQPVCRKLGAGLLAVAIKLPTRSLASRLSETGKAGDAGSLLPRDLAKRAVEVVLRGSPYNCLIIGSVLYGDEWQPALVPGTTPLLWWPLETPVVRDMMLGDCLVVTVYNPAHLIASLCANGFAVERFAPPSDFAFSFEVGNRRGRIENALYFLRLVGVSLLRETYVVELLRLFLEKVPAEIPADATRARIDPLFMHDMMGLSKPDKRTT